MKSVSLPSLVLTSASIQVPSFVLWEMVQSPYKLKPLQPGGLVAGNTLYVGFTLISVKSLIGYITVKIVMLVVTTATPVFGRRYSVPLGLYHRP